MSNKILVTGGAGYIESHTARQLGEAGYKIVVYDNLSTGSENAVLNGSLFVGDLNDELALELAFAQHDFDAVLHFAGSISVSESVVIPLDYYENNTRNTLNLLRCCQKFGVKKFVFSSTAAVYGEPQENPVSESCSTNLINPYGRSKLMSENMIRDYALSCDFKFVILRYFNVAGADLKGRIGQSSAKAAHLMKMACDAALENRPSVGIFGTDFDTPEGTGIRDYIHVEDLATAHIDALRYLEEGGESDIFNCGYGQGYSVREVLSKLKEVSGIDFPIIESPRRPGDPACVIACGDRIREVLSWQPQYNNLETILKTIYAWEQKKLLKLARI